jgi:hypothetical protein
VVSIARAGSSPAFRTNFKGPAVMLALFLFSTYTFAKSRTYKKRPCVLALKYASFIYR